MFVRHKSINIDPRVVAAAGIDVYRAEQNEGDMVITFPRAYHSGYNSGINVAEAANFAHPMWIEYGVKHKKCDCPDEDATNNIVDVELFRRFAI